MSYMPKVFLIYINALLSLQRLEPRFQLVLFHRIDWYEYQLMLLWRLFFSFLFVRIVTRRTTFFFTFELSRIALITIRIATIKNPFRCFYRCSDSFQHQLYQSRQESSPAPACCSKPNHRQWQRIARRKVITAISTSVIRFQLYRLVSLSLRYTLLIDVNFFVFRRYFPSFRLYSSFLYRAFWVVFRELFWLVSSSVIHNIESVRLPDFFP